MAVAAGRGDSGGTADLQSRVRAVRRFNRFYTRTIGLLHEGYLRSPFTLTQVRVLYELAHRERPTAAELSRDLGLDTGHLSRILRDFQRRGLIEKRTADKDGRQQLLWLTERGQEIFAPLEARSHDQIGAMLEGLSAPDQDRVIESMRTIEGLLVAGPEPTVPYVLRPHRSGDMGWVVQRHGVLYAQEYGWDETFEALVAAIVAKFVQNYDAKRERCWIAELEGEPVGSVFCVKKSSAVAQLRLLLVEPKARGLGIGTRLVDECVGFARSAGYRKIMLWTNDVLGAARRIYERAGFRLVEEEKHHSVGHDLVGQNWELKL
jgi:DNA-binding MarR family transcriptional regulator/GNAT superfamily N-acetyltransferase